MPGQVGAAVDWRIHARGGPAPRSGVPGREPRSAVRIRRPGCSADGWRPSAPAAPAGAGTAADDARRQAAVERDRAAAGRSQQASADPRLRRLAGSAPRTRPGPRPSSCGLPVIANGQGRGILPAGHPLLVTRARSMALGEADLVIVAGTPLDFRLGYGQFGGKNGTPPAQVVHLADAADQLATHCKLAGSAAGDLSAIFGCAGGGGHGRRKRRLDAGLAAPATAGRRAAVAADAALLHSDGRADPSAADLRRARRAARAGRGRDRRRRRLRELRGQVRRAAAAGRLARPWALRLPGYRPWLRDRGPGCQARRSGRAAARATARPASR